MGVFSGQRGMPEKSILGGMQKCKRDYEGEINRIRACIKATSSLLMAVDDYCDCTYSDGNATFTLNGLIGGLTRDLKQMQKSCDNLVEEWEEDKK